VCKLNLIHMRLIHITVLMYGVTKLLLGCRLLLFVELLLLQQQFVLLIWTVLERYRMRFKHHSHWQLFKRAHHASRYRMP